VKSAYIEEQLQFANLTRMSVQEIKAY